LDITSKGAFIWNLFILSLQLLTLNQGFNLKKTVVTRKICGKPIINWVKDAVSDAGASEITIFAGHISSEVISCVSDGLSTINIIETTETDNTLIKASQLLKGKKGACLFVCANKPLITSGTLNNLLKLHFDKNNAITFLTDDQELIQGLDIHLDETGKMKDDFLLRIASEINKTGIYVIDARWLGKSVKNHPNPENQNLRQKKLTESIAAQIISNGGSIGAVAPLIVDDLQSVNDMIEFSKAHKIINNRIIKRHMKNGVTFLNPESCIVENDVTIEKDTLIYPGTILEGSTKIGDNCVIGPNTLLRNVRTGKHVTVINSVAIDSSIDDNTKVGPFAYLRPGSQIGKNVKIGDFVEIKKSLIGDDTKISHLTYIGDAEIGKNVNIGCGVVVVNYDGQKKHKTIVGDNSFIGCNVNLVSPVEVKPNAFVAAGSTITEEVPEYSLAIARSRQTIIADWVLKKGRIRGT
jgi:bifunctional UDP-N-acetylglucosamine pyrophosphorylase/glucosamine-1-phosphate N-acetyltransferase